MILIADIDTLNSMSLNWLWSVYKEKIWEKRGINKRRRENNKGKKEERNEKVI